jgi:amino acid adenylation domain-containing protein
LEAAVERALREWELDDSATGVGLWPSSYLQEGLWFSEHIVRQDGLLNLCTPVRMRGDLDVTDLRAAFDDLVARHETLRTTFELSGDTVCQRIHPPAPADVRVIDAGTEEAARDAAVAESLRGFDLERLPLVRVRLYRIAEADHVCLIVIHHLLCDQWSIDVMLRDLAELYAARRRCRPPDLPALSTQYRHFAVAQRQRLQGERLDELVAFWTSALAGAPRTLDVPTDRPPAARRTTPGSFVPTTLPGPLVDSLERLARSERVTLFTLILAAVRILLWQHTGQPDIVVGAPMAARDGADEENLIGLFVNMLSLRNEVHPGATFRDVLHAEFAASLDAFEHRDLPYRKLVEAAGVEWDGRGSPLFRVAVSFGARDEDFDDWYGLTLSYFPLGVAVSQFDLAITGNRSPDGADIAWAFDDSVYDTEQVRRLSERLEPLLRAVVADPDRAIGTMRPLSAADRRQLAQWRRPPTPAATPDDVVTMVEAWAGTPDAPAVRQGTNVVSYAELVELASRTAGRLAALGLPPESPVGLLLRRTPWLPAIVLGVLRSGLAFVPLDVDSPPARIAAILADCGARVVVHDSSTPLDGSAPPDGPWQRLTVGSILAEDGPVGPDRCGSAQPDRLAYVLYTSGSTGTPKGVAVSHGALANCLAATREMLGCRPGQRWLAVSRTAFDISLLELFTPLISGSEVTITTDDESRDGDALRYLLETLEPDVMQATPATWRLLEDSGWRGHPRLTVHTGGDVVPPALAERLIAGNGSFWHSYGPTEATLYCVAAPLTDVSGLRVLPLGEPIAGVEVCVLDESLNPVPPGVLGELCVAGVGLARGYFGRPGLTAASFVAHPAPHRPGERIYRTGDRALRRFDGRLELHGRIDQQIKIRGFRIELGEIEHVLAEHPAVDQAIVVRAGDSPEHHRLVAHLRLADRVAGAPTADLLEDVRAHAKRSLPPYLLPSSYQLVERVPVTRNGKVDRRVLAALSVPLPAPPHGVDGFDIGRPDAGWSEEEHQVAEIWSGVLDVAHIGRHDDFFDLGGNSLLAVRALNRISEVTGVGLSLRVLFEATTVTDLAARIATARQPAEPPQAEPSQAEPSQAEPPVATPNWSGAW